MFAVLCLIYELLQNRKIQLSIIYLAVALIIPYLLGTVFFKVPLREAFSCLLPLSWKASYFGTPKLIQLVLYLLFIFLPLTAFLSFSINFFMRSDFSNKKVANKPQNTSYRSMKEKSRWNNLRIVNETIIVFQLTKYILPCSLENFSSNIYWIRLMGCPVFLDTLPAEEFLSYFMFFNVQF